MILTLKWIITDLSYTNKQTSKKTQTNQKQQNKIKQHEWRDKNKIIYKNYRIKKCGNIKNTPPQKNTFLLLAKAKGTLKILSFQSFPLSLIYHADADIVCKTWNFMMSRSANDQNPFFYTSYKHRFTSSPKHGTLTMNQNIKHQWNKANFLHIKRTHLHMNKKKVKNFIPSRASVWTQRRDEISPSETGMQLHLGIGAKQHKYCFLFQKWTSNSNILISK